MFKWQADNGSKHGLFERFIILRSEIPWHHCAAKQVHLEDDLLFKSLNLVNRKQKSFPCFCTTQLEKLPVSRPHFSLDGDYFKAHLSGEVKAETEQQSSLFPYASNRWHQLFGDNLKESADSEMRIFYSVVFPVFEDDSIQTRAWPWLQTPSSQHKDHCTSWWQQTNTKWSYSVWHLQTEEEECFTGSWDQLQS